MELWLKRIMQAGRGESEKRGEENAVEVALAGGEAQEVAGVPERRAVAMVGSGTGARWWGLDQAFFPPGGFAFEPAGSGNG
jgi:hypothetical protein